MHFDPARGGADRYFDGLLGGLQKIGADVTAAAFGQSGSPTRSAISLGPEGASLPRRLMALRTLRPALMRPGLVTVSHFALYALPLIGSLRKLPHVVHFHGPWADESTREGQRPWVVAVKRVIECRVYTSATRLITLSGAFRDVLVNDYGIPENRIHVVPGGVDVTKFRPVSNRIDARNRLGWPTGKKIILCVRRLVRRMGLENLLHAFASIAAASPDALLVVAGRGPLADELRGQAAALGMGNRIHFAGFLPDADLPTAYTAADFSIVPTETLEGFGLITLESLACGTPVLVTPVGGLPETVHDLDPKLILDDPSAAALARGLQQGLSGALPAPDTCRAYAETTFDWPRIARRVLTIYQEAAHDCLH